MPITTVGVVSAVTPSVVETYISHFFNRGPLKAKPTAHLSYHEGLRLVRQFLEYSSKHAVEDLQAFTAQWVPAPTWVRLENVDINTFHLDRAAKLIQDQLGAKGIEQVGGKNWWQWRRPDTRLRAEWIEMKKDAAERRLHNDVPDRAMLYVHGGAYYFGSVDEHRYQIQRHARKLKTKVLAPRYRLAPQFPFPCGLQDCLATYLFLLQTFDASQILVAGDSAGGGMVLSMLVILRDQGVPLPAGAILLSPWVDLTHSFPSVSADGRSDYIPAYGFHHKPSLVWPPPNADEMATLNDDLMTMASAKKSKSNLVSGVENNAARNDNKSPSQTKNLSIVLDGQTVELKDQIQMYAPNSLLAHPLVSPVQQPSLGGLPPLLIQVGGGELLHDEQVYLAHKAANPQRYIPSDAVIAEYGLSKADITKYPPTYVQLQVWDDLCHVPHTLSFTRPAKYMFRSVAQFGAWALAHAQHKEIEIDDDANSIISDGPDTDTEAEDSTLDLRSSKKRPRTAISDPIGAKPRSVPTGAVGKAGDALPPFKNHMIRQRVDRHGVTYPLTSAANMPCLNLEPSSIGAIKSGPVRKWLAKRKESDARFANEKKKVQKRRLKEMSAGYELFADDTPPPTALAGRRRQNMPAEKKAKKSWALALWSGWGSNHDEATLERSENPQQSSSLQDDVSIVDDEGQAEGDQTVARSDFLAPQTNNASSARRASGASGLSVPRSPNARNRSGSRTVFDKGQADEELTRSRLDTPTSKRSLPVQAAVSPSPSTGDPSSAARPSDVPTMADVAGDSTKVEGSDNTFIARDSRRPHNGTLAYPFKIRNPLSSASTATLDGDNSSIGATATTLSTPAASLAPVESMVAEKEVVMPSFEKEVVVGEASSAFSQPHIPHPERMPSELSGTSSPRSAQDTTPHLSVRTGPRPDTYSPSSAIHKVSPNSASPIEAYRPDANRVRNPAFTQTAATANRFATGASSSASASPIQPAGPPKPVGFAYNPRDLRNAMIHRQALETAAAKSGTVYEPPHLQAQRQPQQQQQQRQTQDSLAMSPTTANAARAVMPAGFHVAPVELPAQAYDNTVDEDASNRHGSAFEPYASNEPVELSTVKQTRVSILPPPRSNPPPTPSIELSAVKQTRNSILPAPRDVRAMLGLPPSPTQAAVEDSEQLPESPTYRMSLHSDDSADASVTSSTGPEHATVTENITMPVIEPRGTAPAGHTSVALSDTSSIPPTPPPKDTTFAEKLDALRQAHNSPSGLRNVRNVAATSEPSRNPFLNGDHTHADATAAVEPLGRKTVNEPVIVGDIDLKKELGLDPDEQIAAKDTA